MDIHIDLADVSPLSSLLDMPNSLTSLFNRNRDRGIKLQDLDPRPLDIGSSRPPGPRHALTVEHLLFPSHLESNDIT